MLPLCLALLAAAAALQPGRSAPAAPSPEPEPQPAGAQCLEHVCFGVFWGRRRPFAEAGRVCAARGGHLLTVRSTVAADAIALLVPPKGHGGGTRLWLGLQLPPERACSEPGPRLRGFRWVTGDDESPADPPWRQGGAGPAVCGRPCVALVAGNLSWEETRCDSELDGFLCEYTYSATCPKLSPGAGLNVTYTTPFGAKDSDLLALPPQTTASAPALGLELVCQQHSSGAMRWSRASPGAWHCQLENGGCEGTCRWGEGTPLCTCPEGEQLNQEDRRSCSFPNPCTDAICEHLCVPQAPLNFSCMCHEGYELAEDGVSCRDIDDCKVQPGLCDQACSNTEGGFQCQCYPGYELVEGKCEDVIDCYEDTCQHKCEDVPGGYHCSCFQGYAPDPRDSHKCVLFCNQNECPADCDPHTQETCFCPDGFVLDQGNGSVPMCVDIDECDMKYCEQLCTNEPGHYRCHCQEGYILYDQHSCHSEDEFSGETEPYPKTAAPTRVPPKADSLPPWVLVVIGVGILFIILVLMALLYHLVKKHCSTQGAKGYTCNSSTEKDVVLQQVTPGCPSANQKL